MDRDEPWRTRPNLYELARNYLHNFIARQYVLLESLFGNFRKFWTKAVIALRKTMRFSPISKLDHIWSFFWKFRSRFDEKKPLPNSNEFHWKLKDPRLHSLTKYSQILRAHSCKLQRPKEWFSLDLLMKTILWQYAVNIWQRSGLHFLWLPLFSKF